MKPFAFARIGATAFFLAGCATAEFYWQGISGQLDLLNRAQPIPAVLEAAHDPVVAARLRTLGAEPVGSSAAELAAMFRAEDVKWGDAARAGGLAAK